MNLDQHDSTNLASGKVSVLYIYKYIRLVVYGSFENFALKSKTLFFLKSFTGYSVVVDVGKSNLML